MITHPRLRKIRGLRSAYAAACFAVMMTCDMSFAYAGDASAWDEGNHSAARLLAGERDGNILTGGIEIRLAPDWKTYWRSPGDSGVPPRLDFSTSDNIKTVDVL
jgi:DsbC/DsbD-like thiol-disulfide interchange protein